MEKAEVLRNERLAPQIFLLKLKPLEKPLSIKPGQFLKLKLPDHRLDPLFPRPFTVHALKEDSFEILYQVVGKGTLALSKLLPGDEVFYLSPLGRPYPDDLYFPLALVAGGVGVSGFGFFLQRLLSTFREKTILYYGARTKELLVRLDFFKSFGIELKVSTEDGSLGKKGLVTELLEEDLKGGKIASILACGPLPMLKAVKELSERYRIKCYLSLETFMACGTGFCKGCVIPKKGGGYFHLCEEGPTLPVEEIIL